jgi:membrane-associated protein
MHFLSSIPEFIATYGYYGIFAIVFTESGIVLGAFLPGDSFLFLTGMLAAKEVLSIAPLVLTIMTAAFMGNEFGYWLGKKYGWKAVSSMSKKYSSDEYHNKAKAFYATWGVYAVIIARFVPVMRSLIPTTAGMADMSRTKFFLANFIGTVAWGFCVTMVGYLVGSHVSTTTMLMMPLVGFLLVGLALPIGLQMYYKKKD